MDIKSEVIAEESQLKAKALAIWPTVKPWLARAGWVVLGLLIAKIATKF